MTSSNQRRLVRPSRPLNRRRSIPPLSGNYTGSYPLCRKLFPTPSDPQNSAIIGDIRIPVPTLRVRQIRCHQPSRIGADPAPLNRVREPCRKRLPVSRFGTLRCSGEEGVRGSRAYVLLSERHGFGARRDRFRVTPKAVTTATHSKLASVTITPLSFFKAVPSNND